MSKKNVVSKNNTGHVKGKAKEQIQQKMFISDRPAKPKVSIEKLYYRDRKTRVQNHQQSIT
jgi:hypothetical protein